MEIAVLKNYDILCYIISKKKIKVKTTNSQNIINCARLLVLSIREVCFVHKTVCLFSQPPYNPIMNYGIII